MSSRSWHFWRLISICLVMVIVLTCNMTTPVYSAEIAQDKDGFFHVVREIYASDLGISNPIGLNFLPDTKDFFVMTADPSDQAEQTSVESKLVSMDEEISGSISIPVANLDPFNNIYDENIGGMAILDRSGQNLVIVPAGSDGSLQTSKLSHRNIKAWKLKKPMGMTVDPVNGQIFVLDLSGPRLVKILPADNGGADAADISEVDLRQLGIAKPQGLALDPGTGNLHLLSKDSQMLYEITQSGQLVSTRDISDLKLADPQSLVFAPSYDQTDDPQQMSLYLADSGLKNGPKAKTAKNSINSNSGRIIELSLYQPAAMAASTYESVLNNTIDTSMFTPSSPDPCGVDYLPSSNTLLICDSEVEEMTNLWANVNLFETTLSGSLNRTAKTTTFTKEPTGIAYNSANSHMFISDDDGHRIFEVAPGTDKLFGTSDDTRTVSYTSYFSSNDPEGVAFDPASNTLFIVDGINEEVYLVKPGANGLFDGVPPYGDDEVSSFDTTILGVHDPEGIGFYPATGYLYITEVSGTGVAEVTVAGSLVQMIDISAASALKCSGIGFGPSSTDTAAVAMYVTDRGIDNNSDPTENDGKVYELSIPAGNSTPTVSITAPANESSYTSGDAITFSGSASDAEDGDISASIAWTSSIDGAIGTGSSFTLTNLSDGTHTITAKITNSKGISNFDSISISVNPMIQIGRFTPTDDAKVSSLNPNRNYGALATLEARNTTYTNNSYLKFNVTGLSGTVKSARIRLYTLVNSRDGGSIYTVSNNYKESDVPWLETGLTYNNAPSISGEPLITIKPVTANSWVDFNVTEAVYGNGEYSFALAVANTTTQYIQCNSSEADQNQPELLIETADNSRPTVSITSPANEAVYTNGEVIAFSGSASDAENVDISANIEWTSSIDGAIGTGGSFTRTDLSVGTHTITADVIDSKGAIGSTRVTITVSPANSAPTVSINAPADGSSFTSDEAIAFSGSASDEEDGDISANITWNSSIDGEIGTGGSFTRTNLSVGIHTITADVIDSKGETGLASVTITVDPANSAPTVSINAPVNGSTYTIGETITFSGSASDAEDGDISSSIVWTSSKDGAIGTGSSFSLTNLSINTHTITASVTDSKGAANTASITITVTPIPQITTFNPTGDAKVSNRYATSNYGSKTTLELIKGRETIQSYLKFNVTGISSNIKSAKLKVYSVANSGNGGSVYVVSNNYKRTRTPWLESGLTWRNAPSVTGEALSSINAVTANSWVSFDVTAAIKGSGQYSFALTSSSAQLTVYNSSEAGQNQPELIIEWY